jgi:hypothetical protein
MGDTNVNQAAELDLAPKRSVNGVLPTRQDEMHLIQLLLPLSDNAGEAFPQHLFAQVLRELSDKFGGSTAYTRSPAEGVWRTGGTDRRDDIVVVEVMAAALDRDWWREYRGSLEDRFRQEELVVRSQEIETI